MTARALLAISRDTAPAAVAPVAGVLLPMLLALLPEGGEDGRDAGYGYDTLYKTAFSPGDKERRLESCSIRNQCACAHGRWSAEPPLQRQ